jgi:hypothetical protein
MSAPWSCNHQQVRTLSGESILRQPSQVLCNLHHEVRHTAWGKTKSFTENQGSRYRDDLVIRLANKNSAQTGWILRVFLISNDRPMDLFYIGVVFSSDDETTEQRLKARPASANNPGKSTIILAKRPLNQISREMKLGDGGNQP